MGFNTILRLLWLILPAYVANGTPVVAAKIITVLNLERHPIDFNKYFFDRKRIFGDNKSWEGFLTGLALGIVTGFIQYYIIEDDIYIYRGIVLSFGALTGDLIGAFIKRRLGIKPGKPLPVLDQILFIVIAITFTQALNYLIISFVEFVYIIITTFILHITTNFIAYLLKLKDVPW
jgi:CDP-2,3-bis-(O-geranylgeranyl)-sn-glycerol synthase